MATPKLTYQYLAMTVRYSSVLFPFDAARFMRAISTEGFIMPESLEPIPLGRRLEIKGIAGRKAEVSIRLDTERGILGVNAPDVSTVIEEMNSIESLVKKEFDLDSSNLAHFYEFQAGLTARAKSNPLKSWHTHFAKVPIMERFSEVLGTKVSPFGIKLAATEEVPNQPDWFEIHIQPLIQSPTGYHLVETVFRRSHRDEVIAFVRKFDDTISALLALIEQG